MPVDSMPRRAAILHAALFLLATSPLWAWRGIQALLHPLGVLALALAATAGFLWWDRRPAAALGLDPRPRRLAELALGYLAGVVLVALIALVLYFALPYPWVRNAGFSVRLSAWSLVYLLVSGSIEELVFRGYSFERLIAAIGHWPAQVVTALVFAVYHVLNGWPWQRAFVGTVLGSILFGLVFVRWRSVPAAIGVHAAGNWTRELLLSDPATPKTYVAPHSGQQWLPLEQFTATVVWNVVVVLAIVAMAVAVYRHRAAEPDAMAVAA